MPKTNTIYVKVVMSYGKPTEFDDVGCDGLYIESTEICTEEIKQLKTEKEKLRGKVLEMCTDLLPTDEGAQMVIDRLLSEEEPEE